MKVQCPYCGYWTDKEKGECWNCGRKLEAREAETMKRIQRKRTAGWRMPPNAVYVGRPTKYGNPFTLSLTFPTREAVLKVYEGWLKRALLEDPHFLDELRGKDLACWCPLDKPCHADVLLKFLEAKT